MTNPNPVAPKTDTPATQIPEEEDGRFQDGNECAKCYATMHLGENEPYRHPDTNVVLCDSCYIETLESTLAAERASRLQADTEQFNAGIEAAVQACDAQANLDDTSLTDEEEAWNHAVNACANAVDALSKPSVSPEQAEEKP